MNKLLDNASKLSALFLIRAQLRADIQADEDNISDVEMILTPQDGWIGKNEGERTIAKMRVYTADPQHSQLNAILRGHQADLGKCLAEIEGLQADISALEFTIRDETNRVMGGKSILDVMQDCEMEQAQTEILSEDQLSEDEIKQIDADYETYLREQEEERLRLEEMQPKLDFEPGSVDDPNSPNYIPF